MATRSLIAVRNNDSTYSSIYCHWDGYPTHHLPILETYDTLEKVNALIELGNLSILDKSIECPEGHTFENPIEGYCVFYGRDRKEDYQNMSTASNLQSLTRDADDCGADYMYIFENAKWISKKLYR